MKRRPFITCSHINTAMLTTGFVFKHISSMTDHVMSTDRSQVWGGSKGPHGCECNWCPSFPRLTLLSYPAEQLTRDRL